MADFSVKMVADDLRPHQINRTDLFSDQLSQRLILRYQPLDMQPAHECVPWPFEALCPDDDRRRVWRRPGKRADPAFTSVRHTGPQPGFMI
ncbi:hypothetical protein TNCV_4643831 [Trichonephila clavipes]|nr:hypothetical protein TNCV_4643831 [Trichonephila clavipes]